MTWSHRRKTILTTGIFLSFESLSVYESLFPYTSNITTIVFGSLLVLGPFSGLRRGRTVEVSCTGTRVELPSGGRGSWRVVIQGQQVRWVRHCETIPSDSSDCVEGSTRIPVLGLLSSHPLRPHLRHPPDPLPMGWHLVLWILGLSTLSLWPEQVLRRKTRPETRTSGTRSVSVP